MFNMVTRNWKKLRMKNWKVKEQLEIPNPSNKSQRERNENEKMKKKKKKVVYCYWIDQNPWIQSLWKWI